MLITIQKAPNQSAQSYKQDTLTIYHATLNWHESNSYGLIFIRYILLTNSVVPDTCISIEFIYLKTTTQCDYCRLSDDHVANSEISSRLKYLVYK